MGESEGCAASRRRAVTITPELTDGRIISHSKPSDGRWRWVSTHEDITERRQAEQRLREQKLQLDTALNNMSQGLNMFDAAGRLVVCNERYLQMYGLSPDVVKPGCTRRRAGQARIASGTFFDADPQRYVGRIARCDAQARAASTTMELPDGRIIAVVSQPTPDGNGWVVTHEDISERRRTEMERDRSQAFANLVIENVPSTIVLKDAQSLRYMLINRAGEEYFGVPRKTMIGKLAEEVFPKDNRRHHRRARPGVAANRRTAILRRAPARHSGRRHPHRGDNAHSDQRRKWPSCNICSP